MGITQIPTPQQIGTRVALITSTSTWVHPDGYAQPRPVKLVVFNGGGGGTGGVVRVTPGANAQVGSPGRGGGSGLVTESQVMVTSNLSITIGAGGAAGPSQSITNSVDTQLGATVGGNGGTTTVIGSYVNIQNSNVNAYQIAYNTIATLGFTDSRGLFQGGVGTLQTGIAGVGVTNAKTSTASQPDSIALQTSAIMQVQFGALAYKYGGGGGGSPAGLNSTVTAAAGVGGEGALGNNGGNAGASSGTIDTNNIGNSGVGAAGLVPGGGGGSGGAANVSSITTSRTATSGAGGAGGAGAVLIFY